MEGCYNVAMATEGSSKSLKKEGISEPKRKQVPK